MRDREVTLVQSVFELGSNYEGRREFQRIQSDSFFVVVCFMVTPVNTQSAMIDQDFFKLEYMNLSSSF